MALRYDNQSAVVDIKVGTAPLDWSGSIACDINDTLSWVVTTVGAGATLDLSISSDADADFYVLRIMPGRIPSTSEGILLSAGSSPLILNSMLHGNMLKDDIFARAEGTEQIIGVIEILEP